MRSLTYCGTAALPGVRIYAGASNKLELQRWTGHAGSGWARFSTPDRNSLPGLSGPDGTISNQADYAAFAFVSTSSQHTFSDHAYLVTRLWGRAQVRGPPAACPASPAPYVSVSIAAGAPEIQGEIRITIPYALLSAWSEQAGQRRAMPRSYASPSFATRSNGFPQALA